MSGRLTGKVAIVTGAGSGIGKATVELFRQEGARVVGADLHRTDFECDAGDEEQVEALVAHVVRDLAGSTYSSPMRAFPAGSTASSTRMRAISRDPPRQLDRAIPGGEIWRPGDEGAGQGSSSPLPLSRVSARRGGHLFGVKGVINLVKVAASQLVGANIRVNAICLD
jgi:NAD(P)-dependent dehydrogenase (short-subunit alcohol dehydrogenase family)